MNKHQPVIRPLTWGIGVLAIALGLACGSTGESSRAPLFGGDGLSDNTLIRPQVTLTVPATQVPGPITGIATNTAITAAFTKDMAAGTLTASSFTVTGPGLTAVAGTVTYASRVASFKPGAGLAGFTTYTATITSVATDLAGNHLSGNQAAAPAVSNYVWTFTTGAAPDTTRPQVTSTVPVTTIPGPTPGLAINTAISAAFNEDMAAGTLTGASFTVTGPGLTPVAGAVTYASRTATFTPAAVLAYSSTYTATITAAATDLAGNQLAGNPALLPAASAYVWTFTTGAAPDTTRPQVTLTVPATSIPGPTLGMANNTAITAAFTEDMAAATITTASFTLTGPGGSVAGSVSYASRTATFIPASVLAYSTVYTATLTTAATDLAGNQLSGNQAPLPAASNYLWTFSTGAAPDLTRPQVTVTVPLTSIPGPTLAVPTNTAITAAFTEDMAVATITTATFTLTGPGLSPVAGSVSYASRIASFTPAAVLAYSTTYTATITAAATDLAGNQLAGNLALLPAASAYVWTFTTGAAPDTTRPQVTLTVPATSIPGPTLGMPNNTAITAAFTEDMAAVTITTASFTLTGPGGPVAGSVSYASRTATFIPASVLAYGTVYTATLTTAATDLAGNQLAGNQAPLPAASNYIWTFSTGAAPDLTRPQVTVTVPLTSIPGPTLAVPNNTTITAAFTEDMAVATITTASFTLTGPGLSPVAGSVSYASRIASFTPVAVLAYNTTYTATLTTVITDLAGNNLAGNQAALPAASNYVWTFTTGAAPDLTRPQVTVTVPATSIPGPTPAMPTNTAITATFTEDMAVATITTATFTLTGPGGPVAGSVSYASRTATFIPASALAYSAVYTATLTTAATDLAGNQLAGNQAPLPAASNYIWTFSTGSAPDLIKPQVTVTVPATSIPGPTLAVPTNTAITAAFTKDMAVATITTASFTLTGPGLSPVAGSVSYASRIASFTPVAFLAYNTTYTATLTTAITDLAGNNLAGNQAALPSASNYVWTFTTGAAPDLTRPQVTLTVPVTTIPGPTPAMPINTAITAAFTKDMAAASITTASFVLIGPGQSPVAGTVSYASRIAMFTPVTALAYSTTYTAIITTAATDLAGNQLAGNQGALPAASDYVWIFTTGTAPDTTRPQVILTSPVTTIPGPTLNVPNNTAISATFSKDMAAGTLTVASFTLTGPGLTPVTGGVTYASRTAVFAPLTTLAFGTTYTATLTTAITDLAGNQLQGNQGTPPAASNYVWTFTTGAAVVNPPTLILTSPANLDINVPVSSSINGTFSSAMDPLTLTTATFIVQPTGPPLGTPISGSVVYFPLTKIATFTPASPLAPNTSYTAIVSSAAKDLAGLALAAGLTPNPWTFTTGPAVVPPPVGINLGSAGANGIMATAAITNTGAATMINGNVCLDPGTSNGLLPAQVNGTIHINDLVSHQARIDLLAAYNFGKTLPPGVTIPGGADLAGLYPLGMAPGTYTSGSTMLVSTPLILDGGGNSNAVWVFQIGSSLTTTASISLVNGAQAGNIYWVNTLDGTIGVGTIFYGTIISGRDVTAKTGTVINGRILAGATLAGTIALDTNTVNVP